MEPVRRAQEPSPEAVEFVRFCYRRRRTGWPEIYDEMCAVAGRGLYHGWTHEDLAGHGIAFSLFELPALAALVRRVIAEDDAGRRSGPVTAGSARAASEATSLDRSAEGPTESIPTLVPATALA